MRYTVQLAFVLALIALTSTVPAKSPVTEGEDVAHLKDLSPYLIDKLHDAKGWPGPKVGDLVDDPKYRKLIEKHNLKLISGPMLGQMTGESVAIWLRTALPAKVRIEVRRAAKPETSIAKGTAGTTTTTKRDLATTLKITGLEPETDYIYQVYVDQKPVFETRPGFTTYAEVGAPTRSTVVFSACSRYIPANEGIWSLIEKHDPDAFLTLGDNVYIDAPRRYGKQRLHYYRRQMRPEYQSLTARTPVYAIWDDHDFGKNDESGGLAVDKPTWKPRVWRVFKHNWNNPAYGGGKAQPGCWFDFYIGDVHFIMTDGRYYRDFSKGTMLGPAQKRWLKKTLRESEGTFTVIASGTLWTRHADKGGADSWWGVKKERNEIFRFIDKHDIPGVVLISGDRHRADVYKIDWPGDYPLWEFENAVLTNRHHHGTRKQAVFSYNKGHMFGVLDFDTKKADPTLTYRVVTDKDKTVYEKTLRRSTLSP